MKRSKVYLKLAPVGQYFVLVILIPMFLTKLVRRNDQSMKNIVAESIFCAAEVNRNISRANPKSSALLVS